jgi:hypothetical protein
MKHSCLSFIHDCVIGFLSFYACMQLFLHACFSSGFFGGVFPGQNLPRRCCETREPPLQSPVFFDTLHQRYDMTLCVLHACVHLVVELTVVLIPPPLRNQLAKERNLKNPTGWVIHHARRIIEEKHSPVSGHLYVVV